MTRTKSSFRSHPINTLVATIMLLTASQLFATPSQTTKAFPSQFKLASLESSKSLTKISPDTKYFVVDFWASWCQVCKDNLTKLEPYQKAWEKKKLNSSFVAVSVDETRDEAKNFFLKDGPGSQLTFTRKNAWFDFEQKLSSTLKIKGIPYLMVVNNKGQVVMTHEGALTPADLRRINTLVSSK